MRKQAGVSFLGFIMLAVLLALAAIVAFKVAPVYVEYFSIKKMLAATAMEAKEMTPGEVRRIFERKLSAEYVEAVAPTDLEIDKQGGQVALNVSYTRKVPLVTDVSLLFEFNVSAKR